LYNTSAVVRRTTVPADTFRAWERRYGLPHPFRTAGNQRLYSERDIGVIIWLRDRTGEGMTISQAIQRLKFEQPDLFAPGSAPEWEESPPSVSIQPRLVQLRQRLIDAVAGFDDAAAERALDEALALFSIEEFCARVVEPVLVEIGERWSRAELPVTAEHFATRLLVRRLAAIFTIVSRTTGRGTIVAACGPGEEHEVGLLILSIFLARRDWRVIYLGANVPPADLVTTIRHVLPNVVCISATTASAAVTAAHVAREILESVDPAPVVVLGGRAFQQQSLRADVDMQYLRGGAQESVAQIDELVACRERDTLSPAPP
jgi:methanogenic corrinoid protein MtbC1